ncbi:hypothetical protein [Streptomyces sp. SAJ15]|uniref:hypothetical protein n=1 Tax=Streptomyces sp. SAJ15 TaxID=2011095 RepID=UPI0011871C22|nr:hypothetical protein [Streptomyces sp. SAJ15]TVL94517.1 hypothetical protein CD790_03420 [Streptomyces sp. SAJ15]
MKTGAKATAAKTAAKTAAGGSASGASAAGRVPRQEAAGTAGADVASAPSGPRPRRVTAAALLSAVEGAVLIGFGVYLLIMGIIGDPESPQQAEMLALTVLALALIPLAAARGLWRRRSWSRGPAMITQIMALPVAWTLVQNGGLLIAIGVVTAAVALAVLALLINPTATEALGIGPRA